MIIANGTIEPKYQRTNPADADGDGLNDKTGYPVKPTEDSVVWGTPIECQFIPNKRNNMGTARGEAFTIAQYRILVREEEWQGDSEVIRLTDDGGRVVGEFSIMSVEPLAAVCEISILV